MKRKSLMIFSLMIIGLFMFTSMVPLVSAADPVTAFTGGSNVGEDVGGAVAGFFSGVFDSIKLFFTGNDNLFAGILMMFIVILLVFTILDFVHLFPEGNNNKKVIQWLVSIAVGILSFIFIDGDQIILLATQYTALGITLTSVLPAIIILTFAIRLRIESLTGKRSYASKIMSTLVMVVYLIYSFALLISKYQKGFAGWVYGLIAVVTLFALLFSGKIIRIWDKGKAKDMANKNVAVNNQRAVRELKGNLREAMRAYTNASDDASRNEARDDYNNLAKTLNNITGSDIKLLS